MYINNGLISFVASCSYYGLWTGFCPIQLDKGSCLFIPQRWLLYMFTVPRLNYIQMALSETVDSAVYLRVLGLNMVMILSGGLATIPWISPSLKMLLYALSVIPFPFIISYM